MTLTLGGKPVTFEPIGPPVRGGTRQVTDTLYVGVVRLKDLPWQDGERWLACCGGQRPWQPSENPDPSFDARTDPFGTAQLALDALVEAHAPLREALQ